MSGETQPRKDIEKYKMEGKFREKKARSFPKIDLEFF
jgi:hypothetical protein